MGNGKIRRNLHQQLLVGERLAPINRKCQGEGDYQQDWEQHEKKQFISEIALDELFQRNGHSLKPSKSSLV
jgi:hypothetical protein